MSWGEGWEGWRGGKQRACWNLGYIGHFCLWGPLPKENLWGTIHLEAKVQSKLTHRGFTFNPCRHQGHTLTP